MQMELARNIGKKFSEAKETKLKVFKENIYEEVKD